MCMMKRTCLADNAFCAGRTPPIPRMAARRVLPCPPHVFLFVQLFFPGCRGGCIKAVAGMKD